MELLCRNCGEPLGLSGAKNGVIRCKYCGTETILPKDNTSTKAKLYLHDGQRALDVGNFDEALVCFDKAIELDSKEPEAFFGRFQAKHKILYLKDVVNNTLQPIIYETSDRNLLQDIDFTKAISLATTDQKEVYRKRVDEIQNIKKAFTELERSYIDYDCFICVKVSDDKTKLRTKDYKIADDIYFALRGKGYKPFFSERELGTRTGSDYEAMILYALTKSNSMLLVCSDEEYLNTKWVKNEYSRFLKLVNDDQKESDAITIVFSGHPIERIPGKKGKVQGININSLTAMEQIEKFVYSHSNKAKLDKQSLLEKEEEEKRLKKEKEEKQSKEAEDLRRMIEEQSKIIKEMQDEQKSKNSSSSVQNSPYGVENNKPINTPSKSYKPKKRDFFNGRNPWIATLLASFFGILGVHYFYIGKKGKGVLFLLTLGLFYFGWVLSTLSFLLRAIVATIKGRKKNYDFI